MIDSIPIIKVGSYIKFVDLVKNISGDILREVNYNLSFLFLSSP